MKVRFQVETVHGLREGLIRDAVRWQVRAAALWEDLTLRQPADDIPDALIIAIQHRLERDYRCARKLVERISDEPSLVAWCKRINRGRRKAAQKQQRRQEAEARRWAAMTPRQRDAALREAANIRVMVDGLRMRDVQ